MSRTESGWLGMTGAGDGPRSGVGICGFGRMGLEDKGREYGTETLGVGTGFSGGGGELTVTGSWLAGGVYDSSPSKSGKSFRLRKNLCSGRT